MIGFPAAILGSFLLMGLAGSLHCVGMCGPLLAGFSRAFAATKLTVGGRAIEGSSARASVWVDMLAYHAGRLWTYAMLGLGVGFLGERVRNIADVAGMHRAAAIVMGAVVIIAAMLMLSSGFWQRKVDARAGTSTWWTAIASCASLGRWPLVATLRSSHGLLARLLLGAVMGLLPCGLVYAMLIPAAALPNPLYSAAAMVAFGVGTLPALTAVLAATRWFPVGLRARGTQVAAAFMLTTGIVMTARAAMTDPETGHCSACVEPAPPINDGR